MRSARAVGGGVHRVRTTAGEVAVKVGVGVLDEAEGLRRLARAPGAPPVPDVLLADSDLLVTAWIDQQQRTAGHDEGLGRMLAGLHAVPAPEWGGGSSWIGNCRVDPAPRTNSTEFYGRRIIELAAGCGVERRAAALAARLPVLLPPLHAYTDIGVLEEGWADRVELFQLVPLLVHAVLFGGGYRAQVEAILRRFT